MKGHTCNMKRSQKTFEPRAISRTSHTQVEMSHKKKVELSSWGIRQISMLIYIGRKNLHTFPHFVYGVIAGECCDFPGLNYKALFWLTCLA